MKKLLGLLGFAAILGMTSLTYAAEPMAASGEMAAPGAQAIKGDLLKIDQASEKGHALSIKPAGAAAGAAK